MSSGAAILLDTHVWIWLVAGSAEHVSPAATRELKSASTEGRLLLSAISVWEVAMLVSKRRLTLPTGVKEWVAEALTAPGLQLVDLLPDVAIASTMLTNRPPKDPADRILIATAVHMKARLATADRRITDYAKRTRVIRTFSVQS